MTRSRWLVALAYLSLSAVDAGAQLPEFTDLVKRVSPAVVNISATRNRPPRIDQFRNEQLPDFFRRFLPPQQIPGPATGSGLSISRDW